MTRGIASSTRPAEAGPAQGAHAAGAAPPPPEPAHQGQGRGGAGAGAASAAAGPRAGAAGRHVVEVGRALRSAVHDPRRE